MSLPPNDRHNDRTPPVDRGDLAPRTSHLAPSPHLAPSQAPPLNGAPLISIRDLRVHFDLSTRGLIAMSLGRARERIVKAVDGISLDIRKGETLGLVGESGCGKSTTGRAILQLVKPTGGHVIFGGKDLVTLSENQMRPQRRHLQMIFQ